MATKTSKSRKVETIKTLILRLDPNLETILFVALVTYFRRVAKALGISTGKLIYRFVSTAAQFLEKSSGGKTNGLLDEEKRRRLGIELDEIRRIAHFNVGGQGIRGWDSHGRADGDEVCSLQVALEDGDFLGYRRWLLPLVKAVMENDVRGTGISKDRQNLREVITSLGDLYPDQPEVVLEWGCLAFYGIFEAAKAGVADLESLFHPSVIKRGIEAYLEQSKASKAETDQKISWFNQLIQAAAVNSDRRWEQACRAVEKAEELGKTAEVHVPALGRKIRVIGVVSDSYKVRPAASKKGYGLTIHFHPGGNCQIHSGIIACPDGKKMAIDMGEIAKAVRMRESRFMGSWLTRGQDFCGVGMLHTDEGDTVPWYLPHFRSSFLNGSRSAPDVPPTKCRRGFLFTLVCDTLPKCSAVNRGQNNGQNTTTNAKSAAA